ncbi:hypothetical protein CASFOL_015918 [Castilleja foliolosa]|uniref:Galactose oxidase n=1 Tax=Castilleja foliolosa TaxID=1961234 RepID=A0ABD3DF29_9LAMI
MPDGSLLQTGGFNDGDQNARVFKPCTDNNVIIIGGTGQFNYEFYPKTVGADGLYDLPFLYETSDPRIENNLYPFVFLNVDGNLFIFANNRAILFDYINRVVIRNYPAIPGGDNVNITADVVVCGGAPIGSFTNSSNGDFVGALNTCGRIRITDPDPQWVMETMPLARVMGDMVLLPNGNVLIVNAASAGVSGWDLGRDPVLSPIVYRPNNPFGSRFEIQASSTRPRMYHSTTILLRDGRVVVSGSNPNAYNNFSSRFPTDLTMEAFSPEYLDFQSENLRPIIVSPASHTMIGYGQQLCITFTIAGKVNKDLLMVTMVRPTFTTHSFSMNQILLILGSGNEIGASLGHRRRSTYEVRVMTPGLNILAPPGYYLLFVVYGEVPSQGIWVQIM